MDLWFKCTIVIITGDASFSVMTHCDKVCVWLLQVKRKAKPSAYQRSCFFYRHLMMTRKRLPWIQWLILNIRNVALHRFYVTSLLFNKSDTEVLYCTQWHSFNSSTGQGYLVLKILMADDGNRLGTSRIFLGVEDPMQHGRGVALADFNRDGKTDIVYGNWNGPHRLYMQLSNRKQKFKVGPNLVFKKKINAISSVSIKPTQLPDTL